MDIIHWISIFFDWIQIRRLLQMDVMAWFIIRIPCWYTMQTITDGWYDMIYNSDTMWYIMQTILFLRITLWFSFLDWLKPESTKFGRFWMIRCCAYEKESLPTTRWFQRIRNTALLKCLIVDWLLKCKKSYYANQFDAA